MNNTLSVLIAAGLLASMNAAAEASTLWRGIAVVTARTATAACIAEYDVGESFIVEYRPNLGANVSETLVAMGEHGAFLISSLNTDADKTLRSGGVSIAGAAYAVGYQAVVPSQSLAIAPASITAATPTISISGTVKNLGITGCNVTARASLLPIFDGPQ